VICTRILPRDEWWRHEKQILILPGIQADDVDVVVVEDGDKLVAAMTIFKATHFEGLWIDPERKGLGAARSLLRLAEALALHRGNKWVIAGAVDDRMRAILGKMEARKLIMEPYLLKIGGA
jgi:hypothetical protein